MSIKILTLIGVLCSVLCGAFCPAQTPGNAGGQLHVKLLSYAVIRGPWVRLSDLLPSGASVDLEARCAQLTLGSAPQRGAVRSFTQSQIKAELLKAPDLLATLEIPVSIRVERYRRALTNSEISKTINLEAGRRGLGGADPLGIKNYDLTAPVMVSTAEPGLKVIRIDADNRCQCTHFRLMATNEQDLVPFTVTVPHLFALPPAPAAKGKSHLASQSLQSSASGPGDSAKSGHTASASANPAASAAPMSVPAAAAAAGSLPQVQTPHPFRPPVPPPVLVEPGALATLLVTGNGFQIKTVVIPLQEGSLGQQIRVRSLENHQVLSAQVVGRNRLRSDL